MTSRRIFLVTFASGILAVPLAAEAQPAAKVPRIGVLLSNSQSSHSTHVAAFRQGLREGGYVEGQNIVVEYRYGDGNPDRLPKLAAELVALNVDVIVTSGTPPTRAAQQTTRRIPVVMTLVGDPIAGGFIGSLSKPGGNITGLTQISPELSAKRLQLLIEAFPKVSRVGVLIDPAPLAQGVLQETRVAVEPWASNSCLLRYGLPTRTWKPRSERQRVSTAVLC